MHCICFLVSRKNSIYPLRACCVQGAAYGWCLWASSTADGKQARLWHKRRCFTTCQIPLPFPLWFLVFIGALARGWSCVWPIVCPKEGKGMKKSWRSTGDFPAEVVVVIMKVGGVFEIDQFLKNIYGFYGGWCVLTLIMGKQSRRKKTSEGFDGQCSYCAYRSQMASVL